MIDEDEESPALCGRLAGGVGTVATSLIAAHTQTTNARAKESERIRGGITTAVNTASVGERRRVVLTSG